MKFSIRKECCQLNTRNNFQAYFFTDVQGYGVGIDTVMIGDRNGTESLFFGQMDNLGRRKIPVTAFTGMDV
jgi:hypothetical protein